jgi:hypothetical protein
VPDFSPDSEPAFHNYINFIQVEKTYFLEEALINWRHKAMRIDVRSPMPLMLSFFSPEKLCNLNCPTDMLLLDIVVRA